MRNVIDKLFSSKKLSLIAPIIFSIAIYVLFLIFNNSVEKSQLIIATPIATIFAYFGTFWVLFVQVKNRSCPERFLNFFELFLLLPLTIYSVVSIIVFVISGFQNFSPILCIGTISWSSISWAHNIRKNMI